MKLELYYYNQCPFCHRVLQVIDSLGLKESIIFKNTNVDNQARIYHLETTGRTTVPCLYIDDKPMFESSDISTWLENNQKIIKG